MILFNQIIYGEPRTKKNSQQIVTGKGGRPFIIPSKEYRRYEKYCGDQIALIGEPISSPVNVKCVYFRSTYRRCDLTNLLEATDDILVKFGILSDDNFKVIRSHDGSSVFVDKSNPRVEIEISEVCI